MRAKRTALERFMAKVDKGDGSGCCLWTGAKQSRGYGQFFYQGRVQLAHRVAYQMFVGPIPDGLTIDHVRERGCTSKACVRPDHLEPVTNRENQLRSDSPSAHNARKVRCQRGHEFYVVRTTGDRRCRTCVNDRRRQLYRESRGR